MEETLQAQTQEQDKALVILKKQGSQISGIDNGINTIIRGSTTSASVTQSNLVAIPILHQETEESLGTTVKQLEVLQKQMNGLTAQLETSKLLQCHRLQNPGSVQERNDEDELLPDIEVMQSISRLCRLAQCNATTLHDDEAHRVIDDIENMIESMSKHLTHRCSAPVSSVKRHFSDVESSAIDHRDLKKVKGLLVSSSSIEINQRSKFLAPSISSSINANQSRGAI